MTKRLKLQPVSSNHIFHLKKNIYSGEDFKLLILRTLTQHICSIWLEIFTQLRYYRMSLSLDSPFLSLSLSFSLSLSLGLTHIKCFCFINVWRDKFGYWEIASLFLRKTRKVIMSYISFPILPSLQAGWRLSGSSSPGISGLSSPLQSRPRALISPLCFAILLSGPPIFRGGGV